MMNAVIIESRSGRYAALSHRLVAAVLDMAIELAVLAPLLWWYGLNAAMPGKPTDGLYFLAYGYGVFIVVHGYTLHRYGQTLGKRLLNIRIETLDGRQASFWRIIGVRHLSRALLVIIPVLGSGLAIFNALLLLTLSRRCLHDRLALTQVCTLGQSQTLPAHSRGVDSKVWSREI
jgi:uncharacterized RDD family membrane protein YckC